MNTTSEQWTSLNDRRQSRSDNQSEALNLQLNHVMAQGNLEAMVLSDHQGFVIASAGEPGVCEELGAFAPVISAAPMGAPLPPMLLGGEVAVRSAHLHGTGLFVASLGGGVARDALLDHSLRGVTRILVTN